IHKGIGVTKSPDVYGGFPTDPYSHTPAHAGGQQPGMTGQVKEDILSRFGELGVSVCNGQLTFRPTLLKKEEFLKSKADFHYFDIYNKPVTIHLPASSLAFTVAQVPFVFHLSNEEKIEITKRDRSKQPGPGTTVPAAESTAIFNRTGEVERVDAYVKVSE
ncbi:MAG: hypothetical protein DWQ10_08225, partial [Calditrichaeota bacterium]